MWIRYLAAGLCGGLLAWALSATLSPVPPQATTSIAGSGDLDPLLTELRALRAAVDRIALHPPIATRVGDPVGAQEASSRQEAGQDVVDPVVVAVDQLQQGLRAEFAALRANLTATTPEETGGLQALLQTRPHDNGEAIRQLCIHAKADPEVPIRELRFLSRREVLARFGRPNEVGSDGDYWSWEITSPDGTVSQLWTRFGAGYVTVASASFEDGS